MAIQLKQRLLKGGVSFAIMRILAMGTNLLLHIIIARALKPEEYGIFLLALTTSMFVATVLLAGVNQGVIKFVSGVGNTISVAARRVLITRLFLIVFVFTGVTTILWLLGVGRLVADSLNLQPVVVTLIFMLGVALAFEQLLCASLRSLHALSRAALFDGKSGGLLTKVLFLIVIGLAWMVLESINNIDILLVLTGVCFLVLPLGLWALYQANGQVEGEIVSQEKSAAASNIDGNQSFSWRQLIRFHLIAFQAQILMFVILRADIWIAGVLVDKTDAALYGSGRWLILQVIAPLQIISLTITSSIAELLQLNDMGKLTAMVRLSSSLLCALVLPFLLVLAFFGGPVLSFFYGDFYAETQPVLLVLCIGQMLVCLSGNAGQLLTMGGKEATVTKLNWLSATAVCLSGWILCQNYGVLGLAWAVALVLAFRAALLWGIAYFKMGVNTLPTLRPRELYKQL